MKIQSLAAFMVAGIEMIGGAAGLADTKQEAARTPAVVATEQSYDSGIGFGMVAVSTGPNSVDIQRLDDTPVQITAVPGEGLSADLGVMHKRQVIDGKQVLTPGMPVIIKVPMDLTTMRVTVGMNYGKSESSFSDQKGHKLSITIGGYNKMPTGGMF